MKLAAKKRSGKGFGPPPPPPAPKRAPPPPPPPPSETSEADEVSPTNLETSSTPLVSIDATPVAATPSASKEPELSPDERVQKILREKYGLGRDSDGGLDDTIRKAKEKIQEDAKEIDDVDIFKALPAPVLKGIDTFLKAGLSITTLLFIAGGLLITVEAFGAATKNPLPEDLDNFIVQTVEPAFTPGLFVLLAFSISLGLFASAQLGSESSVYSEDP